MKNVEIDNDRVDGAALALLSLSLHSNNRVWKGLDWSITDRLYEKGLITNPATPPMSGKLSAALFFSNSEGGGIG